MNQIPEEILKKILSFCGEIYILQNSLVSRYFNKIIKNLNYSKNKQILEEDIYLRYDVEYFNFITHNMKINEKKIIKFLYHSIYECNYDIFVYNMKKIIIMITNRELLKYVIKLKEEIAAMRHEYAMNIIEIIEKSKSNIVVIEKDDCDNIKKLDKIWSYLENIFNQFIEN